MYTITKSEQERSELAEELLNSIITLQMPSEQIIQKLYQQNNINEIQNTIQRYLHEAPKLFFEEQPNIIQTIDVRTTELAQKKQEISKRDEVQKLKNKLRNWETPAQKELEFLFENYTQYAHKHISLFNELKKERSCELPFVMHLIRGALMSEALEYDAHTNKPPKFYNLLWVMHDSREDTFRSIKTPKGKNYKLQEMNLFMDEYFPPEHHEYIRNISNDSDAILKYLKLDKHIKLDNTKTLKHHLARLKRNLKGQPIKTTIEQMLHAMPDEQPRTKDFYETIKSHFYQNVFLQNLAQTATTTQELALYEGKGTIDLLDNFIARHSRDLRDRRASIKKMLCWHQQTPQILETHTPSKYTEIFKDRADQILKHANHGAKELALFYLTRPFEQQDHLNSAITTLLDLTHAIYHNSDPKKLIL